MPHRDIVVKKTKISILKKSSNFLLLSIISRFRIVVDTVYNLGAMQAM